jgi:hypothetical protein
MINKVSFVGAAAALSLAAAALMPVELAASGLSSRHSHATRHAFGQYPFGGMVAAYSLDDYVGPVSEMALPVRLDPVIPPPPALTCSRSREIVTVPSDAGGTRQITITRC